MRILALLALVLVAGPAHADTVYSYVGDTFGVVSGVYTLEDRLTGTLTVTDGFVPERAVYAQNIFPGVLHWSFSDGHQTLTDLNSRSSSFGFMALDVIGFPSAGNDLGLPLMSWSMGFAALDGSGELFTGQNAGPRSDRGDTAGLGPPQAPFGIRPSQAYNGFGMPGTDTGSTNGVWSVQHVAVPSPGFAGTRRLVALANRVTGEPLQRVTAWAAATLLVAPQLGTQIALTGVTIDVAEGCNGMAYLISFALFGVVLGGELRRSRWLIPLAGLALAFIANVLRVAILGLSVEAWGAPFAAAGPYHDVVGWVMWMLALLPLAGLGMLLARLGR